MHISYFSDSSLVLVNLSHLAEDSIFCLCLMILFFWSSTFFIWVHVHRQVLYILLTKQRLFVINRSLPNFEVIWESSLKSVLRWNFRTNMEKMMSSYGNGQISMVELISVLTNLKLVTNKTTCLTWILLVSTWISGLIELNCKNR